jgi:hypothetical protein
MLCNIIYKIKIKIVIYIEGSMSLFIIYIDIKWALSYFDYINFNNSLIIKGNQF